MKKNKLLTVILLILLIIAVTALSFALTSGLTWVICWAFDLTFTVRKVLAIWFILLVLTSNVTVTRSKR